MTGWLPVLLAAAAAAVLAAPGRDGALRLRTVAPGPGDGAPLVLAAAVLAITTSLAVGPAPAVLVAAGGVLVQRSRRRRGAEASAERERTQALDALSMLGAELRAGRTPADALAVAAAVAGGRSADALASAAAAARLGGDVPAALCVEGSAVATMLSALSACWQVCSDAGHGLAAAVEQLEAGLRSAEAQRRSVAAELAGPRATAQLLALLPVIGVALAAGLGADPVGLLLGTPVGLACLIGGLGLDGAGVLWTRRLTERAMP